MGTHQGPSRGGAHSASGEAPQVFLPKDAALRLNISPSMLRKLTLSGEIGHVRLGSGPKRQRFGYTEDQILEFIAARTVPAARPGSEPAARKPARGSRRISSAKPGTGLVARQLLDSAIAAGTATEWRPTQ